MNIRFIFFLFVFAISLKSAAFEIDSFYRRNQPLKDSAEILNLEINAKIEKAAAATKSCNIEELYTNVRNQINADSAGFGVIGGMEGWAAKNPKLDKIDPPPNDQSIYYGTSFDSSILSVGYWLNFYKAAMDYVKLGGVKAKLAVEKILGGEKDPLTFCKVPADLKEMAEILLRDRPKGHPGGHEPGQPPKFGPPPDGFNPQFPPPMGGPLKGFGEGPLPNLPPEQKARMEEMQTKMRKLSESGLMSCLQAASGKQLDSSSGGLEPVINISGKRVGVDKLGHFFDQGAEYFREAYDIKGNSATLKPDGVKRILALGKSQEEGMLGLQGTGIKSYGDMSANYSGFLFWQRLANGNDPIVRCVGGKYTISKKFYIADYVTDAWDEGINCSDYKSEEMAKKVSENLSRLKTQCPADAQRCQNLTKFYDSPVLKELVHPSCLAIINSGGSSIPLTQPRGVK